MAHVGFTRYLVTPRPCVLSVGRVCVCVFPKNWHVMRRKDRAGLVGHRRRVRHTTTVVTALRVLIARQTPEKNVLWKTGFLGRAPYPRRSFSAPCRRLSLADSVPGSLTSVFLLPSTSRARHTAVYVISTITINAYGKRAREFHPLKR